MSFVPSYLYNLLQPCIQAHALKSSGTGLLYILSSESEFYEPCGTPNEQGNAPRYLKLSEHKKLNKNFQLNRPSIWPVKPATMKAKPTPRTRELAKPKAVHKDVKPERSIYTEGQSKAADGRYPKGKTSRSNKEPIIYADVPRFVYLSEPKKLAEGYVSSSSSPIWPVSPRTMRATPTDRILELAKPKQLHKDWRPSRPPYSTVGISEDVLTASNSPRSDELARHKTYIDPPARKSYLWDYPFWDNEISEEAKTRTPTDRILELAKPKGRYPGYIHSRPVDQPVSETALNYTATERIQELAKPKSHIAAVKTDNPFEISEAAKNAVATPRLQQLALPFPRKVTRKKFT
ncbi:sperm microtubule associated protein 2-like [Heptranchias perlo]|uniref:sperm microtubule associated protein 2-like n=1 Tax=Heptranchias perlo TaxID=212740 RepID=UPI00355A72FA